MAYIISKQVKGSFPEVVESVTNALKNEGFGVLTEIDMKATLKKKLDVDFSNYLILGACNPPFAYQALTAEDWVGAMLPCNVVVRENEEGEIEVGAVDPIASMAAIENQELGELAHQVRDKLRKVIDSL